MSLRRLLQSPELKQAAYDAGKQLMELVKKGITAKDIVTKKSFENAIMVHAAISGSTNATMHLPAIAHEFGFEIDADTFDRMHRGAHYLLNIRPSGDWPAQYFYYAGGEGADRHRIGRSVGYCKTDRRRQCLCADLRRQRIYRCDHSH